MSARKYARVQGGLVVELLSTENDISEMFVPELVWIDVTASPDVAEGCGFDGIRFSRRVINTASMPAAPTLAELQSRLAVLSAQIAALAKPD